MTPMRMLFLSLLLLAPASCTAQDIQIRSAGPYVEIGRGIAWGTPFNRTFIFSPLNPDQSACVFIVNNNPTSSHSFSFSMFQTGDQSVADYSNNTGRWIQDTVQGTTSPIAAGQTSSAFIHSNAGAKIALIFSGSTTQAGSPDTADVFVVQTNAVSCGPVNPGTSQQATLSTPNTGTSAAPPIMAVADGLAQSFYTGQISTNPATSQPLLHVNANNNSTRSVYFHQAFISSTVSAQVFISVTSSVGSGCSAAPTTTNTKVLSSVTSVAVANLGTCTTNPTAAGADIIIWVPANTTVIVNLQGFIAPVNTTAGLEVRVNNGAGITGTVGVSMVWYEK